MVDREKQRAYQKEWRKNNPEKVKAYNHRKRAYIQEYNATHKDRCNGYKRKYSLRKRYNLSELDYKALFDKQGGKCAICNRHESEFGRSLCVDHRHSDGVVRGLLCNDCNTTLGKMNDSIERLNSAIQYLSRTNELTA